MSPTPTPLSPPPASPGTGNSTKAIVCPGPLIPNTRHLNITTCVGPCCVKCPAVNSFYEPGKVDRALNAAYVTRQISLVFVFFLMISYMVLPGKRSQPHISVLFLTVSLTLWYASFDVMPGVSNACINDFEQSTGRNSRLCGAQGVLIIYLTQTCCLWCALLIYKLHLLAVWHSDIIDRYFGWLTGFCWIFPLVFAIPVAVKNLPEFPGIGFSCLVSTANLNTYVFYPIGVYIYPAMVVHIVTVAKMIQLAVLSSKIDNGLSALSSSSRTKFANTMQAKRLLRGQWRPALMLFMTMAAITTFWLFYFIEGHRLSLIGPKTSWVMSWYACIVINHNKGLSPDENQAHCAKDVAEHLPSVPWLAAAELILAIVGVVVSLIFISKKEFWVDWAFLLNNIGRSKPGPGARRRGSDTPSSSSLKAPEMERGFSNLSQQDMEPNTRKVTAARVGYNDTLPIEHPVMGMNDEFNKEYRDINDNPGQWVDMDELLDKEYELQDTKNMPTLNHRQQTSGEFPLSLASSSHPHSSEIMYAPSVQESDSNHAWASTASTLSGPGKSYLIANDSSDRYIDQPVVPRPVPRANVSAKHKQPYEPIYLSDPTQSPRAPQASIPSMPQAMSGDISSSLPRSYSEPIPMQGSPTIAYAPNTAPSSTRPSPNNSSEVPSLTGISVAMYNPNESTDIMLASRESLNKMPSKGHLPQSPKNSSFVDSPIGRSNSRSRAIPSALDTSRTKSPPPSIPVKSPARFNSPTGSSPTSPTQLHPDQQQQQQQQQ
ncbi:hypothetical protein BGX34_000084 [Mortierella sp. NVP85]|nr:hypothetical protein BGX34_000084 [Mortierella sp. NVP85]